MKRKKNKEKLPRGESHPLTAHIFYRLREGVLLCTFALAVFLVIALFSYHRMDPGWSHMVHVKVVQNSGGVVGAWVADFLLYLFGYFAYLFPPLMLWAAWISYRRRRADVAEKTFHPPWLLIKLMGFLMILLAGTGLASISIKHAHSRLPYEAGGILGSLVGHPLLNTFNGAGSILILITCFLLGVTLFSGMSWFTLLERLGAKTMRCARALKHFPQLINFEAWQERLVSCKQKIAAFKAKFGAKKADVPDALVNEAGESQPVSTLNVDDTQASLATTKADVVPKMVKAPHYGKSKVLPKLSLLDPAKNTKYSVNEQDLVSRSTELEQRLADFGVSCKVVAVHPGPVVTRYELELAAGTKVSKVSGLVKDLARSLSVISVRVVEVIPGKSVIGIELPNEKRLSVALSEVLSSKQYKSASSALTLALGKDIAGHPVVVDLAKMPHLLVAGTTGSGKSVSLNAMLMSLIYKSTPEQLRMILIDPKMLELAVYDGIPHLLTPVVTDMKEAATALRWCVAEMERRYRLMAALGVRNIKGYNTKVREAIARGSPLLDPLIKDDSSIELQALPQIVILADEFADMMVVVGKKVETLIARLAQKARAAGVHLIFATQRPSVDVITGLIKANIPTRIAFQVSSKIDSRTILDQQGAEQLLGNGDMLYLAPGSGVPVRVHGAFVSDDEVHRVVGYLKSQAQPDYLDDILGDSLVDPSGYTSVAMGDTPEGEQDELYDQAVEFVISSRRVSISSVQRRFKIGYNRAACIVEAMEAAGVVSSMQGNGAREVLVPAPSEH